MDKQKSPWVLQDFVPFGAAAQKEKVRAYSGASKAKMVHQRYWFLDLYWALSELSKALSVLTVTEYDNKWIDK